MTSSTNGSALPLSRSPQIRRLPAVHHVAFLAFFPGYVLLQTLIVLGTITPIFGGLSTPMAVLFLPLLCVSVLVRMIEGQFRFNGIDLWFMSFVLLFGCVSGFHYVYMPSSDVPAVHLGTAIQFISYFLCLRLFDFNDERNRPVFWIAFLACVSTIFVFVTSDSAGGSEFLTDERFYRDYMGYAMATTVTTFCLLSVSRGISVRCAIYIISLAALYVNGARAEFLLVIPAFAANELLISSRKVLGIASVALLAPLAVGALLAVGSYGESSRVLNLFQDYEGDVSYQLRTWALQNGLQTISDSPIFGNYASYPRGLYIHNLLSSWVDLGLVGFLFYTSLVLLPLVLAVKHRAWRVLDPRVSSLVAFALMNLMLAISAKAFTHKLLPVVIGILAAQLAFSRRADGVVRAPALRGRA